MFSSRRLRRAAGLTGLFLFTVAGPALAQNPNANNPAPARDQAGQGAGMLVHHALDMAIDGSVLQLTARELAANDAARADKKGSEVSERLRDLQRDARHDFEGANRLLADAEKLVRNGQEGGWTRRYYDAAARYTKTLYGVIGEPLAKSEDFGARTDQAKGKALTASDIATVNLLNHAVKEAVAAHHVRRMTAHAAEGTGNDSLREHAKEMAAHSQRCLGKLAGQGGDNARDNTPSIALLARQARDLAQVLEDEGGKAPNNRER